MEKPTEEQLKEFWERRGLRVEQLWWVDTSGSKVFPAYKGNPPVDLNNLFKYAVPKIREQWNIFLLASANSPGWYSCELWDANDYSIRHQIENEDPALALFWALWEIKES